MRIVGINMVVLGLFLVACGGGEDRRPARTPVSTVQTTSAALTVSSAEPAATSTSTNATMAPVATPRPVTVETASAVMRVTTSRCDREAACNNVGTGREYGDREECVNEVGHYVVTALPSDQCPAGVDSEALSTCIRDLQAEPCENGGAEAVERLTSCSRERLCASAF